MTDAAARDSCGMQGARLQCDFLRAAAPAHAHDGGVLLQLCGRRIEAWRSASSRNRRRQGVQEETQDCVGLRSCRAQALPHGPPLQRQGLGRRVTKTLGFSGFLYRKPQSSGFARSGLSCQASGLSGSLLQNHTMKPGDVTASMVPEEP